MICRGMDRLLLVAVLEHDVHADASIHHLASGAAVLFQRSDGFVATRASALIPAALEQLEDSAEASRLLMVVVLAEQHYGGTDGLVVGFPHLGAHRLALLSRYVPT